MAIVPIIFGVLHLEVFVENSYKAA